MRAALYNESRALRLANQADSRRSAACLPRGCDFGTEDRATESGALPRRAGRPRPAGRSIDADDGVPAAYLRPAGRRAPVVDDARDDDIVIIVRGGRRRSEAAEQRVVYVDQGPSTRYDERYADEDFVDVREPVPPRRWDLPRRDVAPPAFFPAPIRDDRKAVAWEVPTSTEQRARTAFGAGRRLARARGRPAEEPLPAPPPKALPPTPPTAQTPPHSSSSDDEPALTESDVFEATAGAIREVNALRAAAIDGSLTLKMTRAAVVDSLGLGAGGDRLLKRTYKECMKAAMLEVAGALQLDQSPAVNDAMSQLGAILDVSERPAEAAAVDLALLDEIREERSEQPAVTVDLAADDESAPSSSTPSVTSASPPAYQEEPFSPAWADLTLAAPAGPVGLGPLPPDSALAARAAMPTSSSSSSSDDDMPSLSSSVASPAPAAASPAGAPTSEPTRCRTTPDPAGALQFDATPTSAAAAELEHSPASVTTPSSTLSFATPVAGSPGRGTQTQRAATTSTVRGTQTETPRHAAATCGTQTPPPQVYVASPESVMRSVAAASARPRAVELEKSMRELDLLVGELERAATRASPATTASPMLSPPSDAQIEERLSSARRHRAEAVATKDTGL